MLTKCELFTFFLLKRYILCYNYLRKEEDVMSKIRLKTKLNNKENSFEKKINGILNNQILTFYEDKIKVKIEIQNDKVKIIRSTDEYKITMDFQKFLTIEGKYDIKNIGILDLKTKTKELIIKDNKIYIEKILYINNEDLGLNIYEIEYEAI